MTSRYFDIKWREKFFRTYWRGRTFAEKAKYLAGYIIENAGSQRFEFANFEYNYLYKDNLIPAILKELKRRGENHRSRWILMQNNCWYLESSLAFYKCPKCKKSCHKESFSSISNQFKINWDGECSIMCNTCRQKGLIKSRLRAFGLDDQDITEDLIEAKLNVSSIKNTCITYKKQHNDKASKNIRSRKQLSRA